MKQLQSLLTHPLLWFISLPSLVIGICSFFIPLQPDALVQTILQKYHIELHIQSLKLEIVQVWQEPFSPTREEHLTELYAHLEDAQKEFSQFENKCGRISRAGKKYQPFIALMSLMVMFFALAITWYRDIPFHIRAGSISTGTVLAVIVLTQMLIAGIRFPSWHTKLTAALMIPLFVIGFSACWFLFIKNFYLKRNNKLL